MKEGFPQDRDPRLEHVETGVCSLASEKRPESNEDAWLNDPERLIFGVFDGRLLQLIILIFFRRRALIKLPL